MLKIRPGVRAFAVQDGKAGTIMNYQGEGSRKDMVWMGIVLWFMITYYPILTLGLIGERKSYFHGPRLLNLTIAFKIPH